ncbi:MAG: hypothetical protein GY769_15090 [bacterium]|nr:hypothetical protein [bacterium]
MPLVPRPEPELDLLELADLVRALEVVLELIQIQGLSDGCFDTAPDQLGRHALETHDLDS